MPPCSAHIRPDFLCVCGSVVEYGKTKLQCAIYLFCSNCICGVLFLEAGDEARGMTLLFPNIFLLNQAKTRGKFLGFVSPTESSASYPLFPTSILWIDVYLLLFAILVKAKQLSTFSMLCFVLHFFSALVCISKAHSSLPGCCLCVMIHNGVLKPVTLPLFPSRATWMLSPLPPTHL
ncbi:UNVERIFIED_CONTAM: hypothetical protein K2H54_047589 [Gekko kuhli]